jgi:hypothetical protein
MTLWGLHVQTGTLSADGVGLTALTPIGSIEPDTAVAVRVVVPVDECTDPAAGLDLPANGRRE